MNADSALVLDGHLKSALAIVRSLGRAGISVTAGATHGRAMALHSRFANARFVYPSPYVHEEAFIEAVRAEAVRVGGRPVVYACSDATHLALYRHRDALRACMTLMYPDQRSVEIAFDKAATYSLARVSNVPSIPTYIPAHYDELIRVAASLSYPAVVKPRRTVTIRDGVGIFGSVQFVQDADNLVRTFTDMQAQLGEAPLIQERIVGEEYGVEMIAHKGAPIALAVHHRLRSLSPTGGASVLKATLRRGALYDQLVMYAETLSRALLWDGPLMVEFKVDGDTRTPKLMELNGRFWGSLPLAIAANVDMPLVYFHLAAHGAVPRTRVEANEGITTRHFMGDAFHLFRVLFSRDPMRSYAYPSRGKAIRDFFRVPKGTSGDIWSWRDPKPAVMELIAIFSRVWR